MVLQFILCVYIPVQFAVAQEFTVIRSDGNRQLSVKPNLLTDLRSFKAILNRKIKTESQEDDLESTDLFLERLRSSVAQRLLEAKMKHYTRDRGLTKITSKKRIYSMIMKEMKTNENKVRLLNTFLDGYWNKWSTRQNLIANYFNANFMRLVKKYEDILSSYQVLNVFEALKLYTDLHSFNEFLSEFLTWMPRDDYAPGADTRGTPPAVISTNNKKESISWNYYDDSLGAM